MTRSVIITAGGEGKRMGSNVPKQFLVINNRPILLHTIEKFYRFDPQMQIILVLPEEHLSLWNQIWGDIEDKWKIDVCIGGKERFHSIQNGLKLASGEIIGVHDGVRPLVSEEVIQRCFEAAEEKGAAIPVVEIKESIRKIINGKSQTENRNDFRIVQTPQCFKREIIFKAYECEFDDRFTDDASVVEKSGARITIVEGNDENIKITTRSDIKIAEALMS